MILFGCGIFIFLISEYIFSTLSGRFFFLMFRLSFLIFLYYYRFDRFGILFDNIFFYFWLDFNYFSLFYLVVGEVILYLFI